METTLFLFVDDAGKIPMMSFWFKKKSGNAATSLQTQ